MAVSSEGDRFLKNNALGTVTHVSARLRAAAPLLAIHRLRTLPIISAFDPVAAVPLSSDAVWMNRLGAIVYGAAVGGIVLLFARETLEPSIYLFQEHDGGGAALGVTGWLIATLGPLALSVCVWIAAPRLQAPWLVHLIFIPTAIVIFKGASSLFFYAAGVSGDGTLGGYAMLAASGFLLLTLLVVLSD